MSLVKNRLTVYGGIKDMIKFISENYERDIYHPSDGKYPPNFILFFGKSFPTPDDILEDKNKIYRWRMNNWGTPFLSDSEGQENNLIIYYKHDYDYTPYKLTSEDGMFNPYVICKLSEYSEMFYGENIHPEENELISDFNTTLTPPTKMISNWIDLYKYSTLKFRLDYWDIEDRFVGNIHYDYSKEIYILEHYVKEHDLFSYIDYMLEGDIKTIEDYAGEITDLIIDINPDKSDKDYKDIETMVVEEIEYKKSFIEQVKFITTMISYLTNRKMQLENP